MIIISLTNTRNDVLTILTRTLLFKSIKNIEQKCVDIGGVR